METVRLLFFLVLSIFGELAVCKKFGLIKTPERIDIRTEKSNENVTTFWFNQTLNHFDSTNIQKWKQRYFVNDAFYKPGSPIFLFIGAEGEFNKAWMSDGAWITYAKKLNAFCFGLEHRYYGKSHPTPDLSIESMKYLSSEQALADLAHFTGSMNEIYSFKNNPKWMAFGGSYSGSLAAWYRLKYPHLVYAAVASSPAVELKLNLKENLGVVRNLIYQTSPDCLCQIEQAVQSMEELLKQRENWPILVKTFNLCEGFQGDNAKDLAYFFESLAYNFEKIAQYEGINSGTRRANITLNTLCNIMTSSDNESTTPMERYAKVNLFLLAMDVRYCIEYNYSAMVEILQENNWNSRTANGQRQFIFQTCNEFGIYPSSDLEDQPFGHRFGINYYVQQCQDIYGAKFTKDFINKGIHRTNMMYGGKKIKGSRIIFVNGSHDPYKSLGFISQKETQHKNIVIFIHGTAHCADLYGPSPKDLPQLTKARNIILKKLKHWLK